MKKIILAFFCLNIIQVGSCQSLTEADRAFAIDLLEANTTKFLTAIENVNGDQWIFKSAPDKWSIADVAEHITAAESFLFARAQKILESPADVAKAKAVEGQEKNILSKAADRSKKRQAPEMIMPSGKFTSKAEIVRAFKAARSSTINYIATTNDSLKDHIAPHPAVGDLSAYQWFIWIAAHADRHVAQLEEIKANTNFPKP